MDITIAREALVRELALAESVASKKPTIPETGSVLLRANGEGLRLSATDLEIGVRTPCAASVTHAGACAVPARKFFELVRSFPEAPVRLLGDASGVGVTAGGFKGRLATFPVDNFPILAAPETVPAPLLPAELFRDLILRTRYAVTADDKRYYLAGALLEVEPGLVRLVATDAHRLAIAEVRDGRQLAPVAPVIIPKKTLDALASLLDGTDDDVCYARSEQHLFFQVGERLLLSRQIDGTFPAYRKIVPSTFAAVVDVDRAALLDVLRRSLLVAESSTRRVAVALAPGALFIKSRSADVGDAEESVAVGYDGPPATFSVNGDYVADFLEAAQTELVRLQVNNERSAIGIEAVGGDVAYKYVVMPQI